MKLRGVWLVLAERVIVDAATQNLTLVSCLEQVAAARFPSLHHGFGVAAQFRCVGAPPKRAVPVAYRLLRLAGDDPPEVVAEYEGDWSPGTPRARVVSNFRFLRLRRPEAVTFRMDHRVRNGPWIEGPSCSVDVVQIELTPAEQAAHEAEAARLGLGPAP